MKSGLSNLQFITLCIIVMICGFAIVNHDSFEDGKNMAYDSIALAYRNAEAKEERENTEDDQKEEQGEEEVNEEDLEDDGSYTPSEGSNSGNYNSTGDTSSDRKSSKRYKYVGWIKIPKMGLYKGFLANRKNNVYCVDHDICSYSWANNSPKKENSKLVIGAHNGSRSNAYFRGIEVLKKGDNVFIEYKGKSYKYEMIQKYRRPKSKHAITVYATPGKELYLFTCAKENHYAKNYLVMRFKFVSADDM